MVSSCRSAKALREISTDQLVLFTGLDEGAPVPLEFLSELRRLNVPYFASPNRALRALAHLRGAHPPPASRWLASQAVELPAAMPIGTLSEYESKQLLTSLAADFPRHRLVKSLSEAHEALIELRGPVALKAQSRRLPHKSEAGGVRLGIEDSAALDRAWDELAADIAKYDPGLELDGVLVERMAPKGMEFIVGARRDPHWGPTLLAGFGGVQAELIKDVCMFPGDADADYIEKQLNTLRGAAVLHGYRGSPELDISALTQLLMRLGALVMSDPRITEIDLNPVFVYPKGRGVLAVDALLVAAP